MISRVDTSVYRRRQSSGRRGNTLILVAGMLVLLVIIATVFLSRTQSLRDMGRVHRQRAFSRDRTETAALEIAQEVADALFVREIDYTPAEFAAALPPDESRRESLDPKAIRYGVDPDFAWNRAPWEVSPWTNPPDWLTWPLRPGPLHEIVYDNPDNPDGRWDPQQWLWADLRADEDVALFDWPEAPELWPAVNLTNQVLQPRENPLGGPGTSDTRWLRDIEPQRVPSRGIANPTAVLPSLANPFMDRNADAFSHWRHLTYLGRAGNGWRMCPDIADVTGERSAISEDGIRHNVYTDAAWADGRRYYGGVVQRTDVPIEQWPAMVPSGWLGPAGEQTRVADNWTTLSGDGFHWGDTATTTFLPETESVSLSAAPTDMTQYTGHLDFWDRWLNWLRPEGYKQALLAARNGDGTMLPSNFYDLNDLDGDGVSEYYDPETDPSHPEYSGDPTTQPLPGDPRFGESEADEFIPGTARWHVNRILTDTDGDGFTDSFWWLSPHVGVDDTRQIVGVSITDNSGRINANVATRFERQDDGSSKESTRGWTPASTALVSQNSAGYGQDSARIPVTAGGDGIPVWNTGFFDIESHQPWLLEAPFYGGNTWDLLQEPHPSLDRPMLTFPGPGIMSGHGYSETPVAWNANYWRGQSNRAWLEAMNIDSGSLANPFFPDGGGGLYDIADRDNRLFYFKESGQESQHPQNIFTPFGLADEFELRAHEGSNSGYVYSRLERAIGGSQGNSTPHILRGKLDWPEHSEPLDNRQLASDLRHRMTFFSAARNETRPPYLWWSQRAQKPRAWQFVLNHKQGNIEGDLNDVIVRNLHERFLEQSRLKLDLREYERPSPPSNPDPDPNSQPPPEYQPYAFSDLLAHNLMLGLTSGDVVDRDTQPQNSGGSPEGTLQLGSRDSYFGKGDAAWEKTRRMAAAMAANMMAMRDPDSESPLYSMEGNDPLVPPQSDPEYMWIGDRGAVALPIFEQAYVPDRLGNWDQNPWSDTFQNGSRPELLGGVDLLPDDLDGLPFDANLQAIGGNLIDDFVDLSDASLRDVLDAAVSGSGTAAPPVAPWDVYKADLEWVDPADPQNPVAYQEDRLFAEHDAWTGQYSPEIHELGVEAQPFIAEAFVAVVGRPWKIPGQPLLQPGQNQDNSYNEYENADLWTWATAYTPPGENNDGEWGAVVNAQNAAGDYFTKPEHRPQSPRVVFAVQLINPYDEPVPLLDEFGQPIYSLNFFRPNRHDASQPPLWTIPIDPRPYLSGAEHAGQPYNGTLVFDAMTSIDSNTGLPDGDVIWDRDNDHIMDLTPVLPPATNDRPYSLTIIMNGLDDRDQGTANYDFDNQPFEAARWLDFLDAEQGMHPSSDVDGDGNIGGDEFDYGFRDPHFRDEVRWIAPGELIWSIRPNHHPTSPTEVSSDDPSYSNVEMSGRSMPSLAKFWYGQGVGKGVSDTQFSNLAIDAKIGVGIELVRRHARDWNQNGNEDPHAESGLNDYTAEVVIDRTVGTDGIDEFAHAVQIELAQHRQPSFADYPQAIQPVQSTISTHFPVHSQISLTMEGETAAATVDTAQSWLYPRALYPAAGNKDQVEGRSTLDPMYRIAPSQARWMQWARYSRAWAVDDFADQKQVGQPSFADAEYATNLLDWVDSPVTSRRWRPDRAAPRFVPANSRVTRSWSRDWAAQLGELPNSPTAMDVDGDDVNSANPSITFPEGRENTDPNEEQWWNVLRMASWDSNSPAVGPSFQTDPAPPNDPSNQIQHLVVATEDPLLIDANLPKLEPYNAMSVPLSLGATTSPLRLDRRRAEQKGQYSHFSIDAPWVEDVDDVYSWKQWLVTDSNQTNQTRDVRVLFEGDPELDRNLPNSSVLLDGDTTNDAPQVPPPFLDQSDFISDWGAGWYRTTAGSTGEYGQSGFEMADTYSTLLRYRHGHIYSTAWDPDGIGRIDADDDGWWDTGSNGWQTADPYSSQNPYPYPWATRNVRLPWTWTLDNTSDGTPEAEYRIFQAAKPCFFGFDQMDRDDWNDLIRKRDAGYDQAGNYGAYNFSWSYPDKGWYGPAEIDGELLMPHGFQVQPKNANFEQVGEVLNAMTVAHELYLPLKTQNFSPTNPVPRIVPSEWWVWPPEPSIPEDGGFEVHPASGQMSSQDGQVTPFNDRIATLRTFSEGIADRLAEGGDTVRAGRLLLAGTQHGPNAIVGDPYHQWFADGGDASYDLRHVDFDSGGFGGMDPQAVPHWVLKSTDLSHMEPDLPASQRLLDMFVCDGPGIYDLVDNGQWAPTPGGNAEFEYADGRIDDIDTWSSFVSQYTNPQFDARTSNFDNAGGFDRSATSGMININTAPAEVLRSMPHMHRLVHADPTSNGNGQWNKQPILDDSVTAMLHTTDRPISPHPRSAVADAIVQFRDGNGHIPRWMSSSIFDPLRNDAGYLLAGIPDGAPYPDRGYGLPNAWWGSDNLPDTDDDLLAKMDQFYEALSIDPQYPSLGDVDADETIRFSRGERGFAGIGELFQLSRPAYYDFAAWDHNADGDIEDDYEDMRQAIGSAVAADAWRMDWASRNPFGFQDKQVHGEFGNFSGQSQLFDPRSMVGQSGPLDNPGSFLSTDTGRLYDTQVYDLRESNYVAAGPGNGLWDDPLQYVRDGGPEADPRSREVHLTGDRVASDAEEQGLLFSGISNIVTTRSDVFTVHLRVRTFKRDSETNIWDATDPKNIVEDARYVMVVDRSEVNHPGDRPRILMMQRVAD